MWDVTLAGSREGRPARLTSSKKEPKLCPYRAEEKDVPTDAGLDISQLLAGLPERISHMIRPHAQARPDHPALVDHATSWSYGRLLSIVTDLASALRDLGVRSGDRIM